MMEEAGQLVMSWRTALLGSVMLPLVLCAIAIVLRCEERRAGAWFAALIVSAVLSSVPFFIGFAGAYDVWPGLTYLPVQIMLLFGPFFYLHAHALMTGSPAGWRLWLLLPGFIDWIYQCWAFTMLGDYKAKWAWTDAVHDPYIAPATSLLGILLILVCAIAVLKLYIAYQRRLPELLADEERFQPIWLRHFLFLGALSIAGWLVASFLGLVNSYDYFGQFWSIFGSLFLLLLLSLETFSRVQLKFPKMQDELLSLSASSVGDLNDEPGNEKNWKELGEQLMEHMRIHKWYLETGLSLTNVAQRMGMNRAYVSRALNEGLKTSFSNCVNQLRIESAKTLLSQPEKKIVDVALAAGFGSKASFNRVFRRLTGKTPTEFREHLRDTH